MILVRPLGEGPLGLALPMQEISYRLIQRSTKLTLILMIGFIFRKLNKKMVRTKKE